MKNIFPLEFKMTLKKSFHIWSATPTFLVPLQLISNSLISDKEMEKLFWLLDKIYPIYWVLIYNGFKFFIKTD